MASGIYNSLIVDALGGATALDLDGASNVKVMLLTNAYGGTATQFGTHDRRDDVTANEVSGTGYTTGGNVAAATVTNNTGVTPDTVTLGLAGTTWPSSTITARYAVYYRARGGAASADELIACVDFGSDVTSTAGTFTLNASTMTITLTGQG